MSRTHLKQQLMREQLQQEEQREALQRQQKQRNTIKVDPTTIISTSMDTSDMIDHTAMIKLSENNLDHPMCSPDFNNHHHHHHVTSHPTQFNSAIAQHQQQQHHHALTNSNTESGNDKVLNGNTFTGQINYPIINHHHGMVNTNNHTGSGAQSPFPLSPDSPLSGPRSSASEIDEIWEDVHRTLAIDMPAFMNSKNKIGSPGNGSGEMRGGSMGLTTGGEGDILHDHHHHHNNHHHDHDHHHAMDPAIASTLPVEMFVPFTSSSFAESPHSQMSDKLSTSCPPLSEADYSAWERERKKKDAHNRIERRRRYHINDRIKELSTLLPTQNESRYYDIVKDMKQNKGTILKASVDFLKSLKQDVNRIPELERQNKDLEIENRKMSKRIQQLEQDLRSIMTEERNPYSN